MSDPYFQSLFADRIGGANYGKGTAIYKFEKIKRAKRKALADHPERKLLDFGIGENDEMAPEVVRRRMAEEINKPENRGYADNGIRRRSRSGRPLHAARVRRRARPGHRNQPLHRLEERPRHAAGLLHQPGRRHADDRARLPRRRHAHRLLRRRRLQAAAHRRERLPARPWTASRPTSVARPSCSCSATRTARPAARRRPSSTSERSRSPKSNEIVIIQDAAHGILSYDRPPNSFLAIPGAKDVGVEVHSMSKAFDMIGWRIGWVCGHERIVRAFADVKDNLRLRPVHRHPESGHRRPRRPRNPQAHAHQIPAPPGETRRHAQALRLPMQDARRHVLPLRPGAARASRTAAPAAAASTSKTPKPPANTSSPSNRSAPSPGTTPAHSSASAPPTKRPTKRPKTPSWPKPKRG